MYPPETSYLFIELAAIIYLIGFCGPHLRLSQLLQPIVLKALFGLSLLWFLIDQLAVHLGLWSFPQGGTLNFRALALPLEEYLVFFLHTVVCLGLLQRSRVRR